MEKVRYMISDAATLAGVESHVLRYWEDELDLNIPRNEMGHRYYTRENIQEFQRIKDLKEQGYQLKAIRMILHNGDVEEYQGMLPDAKAESTKYPDIVQTGANRYANGAKAERSKVPGEAKLVYSGQERDSRNEKVPAPPKDKDPLLVPPAQVPGQQQVVQMPIMPPPVQQPVVPEIPPEEPVSPEERMAQFRELMSNIVGHAIAFNNEELSVAIGQEVKEQVLKELNYLVREQEEAAEDRYKRLDAAIRGNVRHRKMLFQKSEKPPKDKKKKEKNASNPAVQGT